MEEKHVKLPVSVSLEAIEGKVAPRRRFGCPSYKTLAT